MIAWLAPGSPAEPPPPSDPAGWVPAAVVGAALAVLWGWAYVARRRARRR